MSRLRQPVSNIGAAAACGSQNGIGWKLSGCELAGACFLDVLRQADLRGDSAMRRGAPRAEGPAVQQGIAHEHLIACCKCRLL